MSISIENKVTLVIRIIAMFALVVCMTIPAVAQQTDVRVLASYPTGTFLENLEVQPDGRLLFTNYPGKSIEVLSPAGETSTFAELSAYPMSLISTTDGYLVAATGKSLLAGEDVVKTQQFILLDRSGKQIDRFDAPQAMFLNGMVRLDNGTILVADSIAGTIWKVDTKAQEISPWLQDKSLTRLADQKKYVPGVNGMKLRSDGLIVSNTSQGTLCLIRIGNDGNPAGKPEKIASVGMIDDFWVREDGSILFTTHAESIKLLSTDGVVTVVATQDCLGSTAVAPYPLNQSNSFVVITDGGLYFGKKDPAKVVSLSIRSPKEASRALVTRFFTEVWNAPCRLETIDELVDEEFIITSAGTDIKGRDTFKKWVQGFGSQINDLKVHIQEMIVTDDGQRVVTRMVGTGGNNGMFGTDPDNAPVSMTLISIIAVRDGKIVHNWVERSAYELQQRLISKPR